MLGVLWMDDSATAVADKIKEAAKRYRARFGVAATLCYANPADAPESGSAGGVRVEARGNIPRNHFLVGREDVQERSEEKAA